MDKIDQLKDSSTVTTVSALNVLRQITSEINVTDQIMSRHTLQIKIKSTKRNKEIMLYHIHRVLLRVRLTTRVFHQDIILLQD